MRRALLVLTLVLTLVVGAGVGLVLWRGTDVWGIDDLLGRDSDQPEQQSPATVPPPTGLDLPDPSQAPPVARPLPGGEPRQGAVRRAIGKLDADRRLGRHVAIAVSGLDGEPVYTQGRQKLTPASTTKLVTSTAALAALGPEHRFTTSTRLKGKVLTLVGGGDPLLESQPDPDADVARADLATLAKRTARQLRKRDRAKVALRYDVSLFSGPEASPAWEPSYLPDNVVSPITALWIDEGRVTPGLGFRVDDPAQVAADEFARLLRGRGIKVRGAVREAGAPDANPLAEVAGAELVEVVQHILEVSDNEGAEVLLRHVGLAEGRSGSFRGGQRAVAAVLEDLGQPLSRSARLLDGSGLSRQNRIGADDLLGILALAASPKHPELSGVLEGLPVAGFSGSLAGRFDIAADRGLGWVRAKTGTLTGVHGLAGVVTTRDDTVLLFVVVADRVKLPDTLFTRARLDQITAALAGCDCS